MSTMSIIREFKLNDKEIQDIEKWKKAIAEVYGEEGTFQYRFSVGTGIGLAVSVWSDLAQIEKDFTDYESW